MQMPAFATQSGFGSSTNSALSSVSSPSASPSLDGPPPHTAPRPAGADTKALMGNQSGSDISMGAAAATPLVKTIAAITQLMDAVNQLQSVLGPSAVSPQFQMEVQQLMQSAPMQAQQLMQSASMASPGGMLSSAAALAPGGGIGQSANSGLPTMPSLGQSAAPGGGLPSRM